VLVVALSNCVFNYAPPSTGMALGDALQENKVLKTLNVANNSIDSVACLTICAGVLENEVTVVYGMAVRGVVYVLVAESPQSADSAVCYGACSGRVICKERYTQ
jgi:hypothetical protein